MSIASTDAVTNPVLSIRYEFSVDGGGTWRTATPLTSSASCSCDADTLNCSDFSSQPAAQACYDYCVAQGQGDIHGLDGSDNDGLACENLPVADLTPIKDTGGIGYNGTFQWDAITDQAIGDNARFRIRVIQAETSGPVQRATAATSSPPFRVRAITCVWPEGPQIRALPSSDTSGGESDIVVDPYTTIRFTGKISAGTGVMYYTWDFGDGETAEGQVVEHSFTNGTYALRMAVKGNPCPQTRERADTVTLKVGTGYPDMRLPLITVAISDTATNTDTVTAANLATAPAEVPPQVTGLNGDAQEDSGAVWLRWDAPATQVDGYRVYRGPRDDDALTPLVDLSADATAYQDPAGGCDLRYYVTTVVDGVESLPSAAVYYSPACSDSGR